MGGEEGLDPAIDFCVAQLERRGPVGVATPAHVAHLVSAFLERGAPGVDECDHGVLVAQPELLQLRKPFVDLVGQYCGLLGDNVPQLRVRWTRSIGAKPDQVFSAILDSLLKEFLRKRKDNRVKYTTVTDI